MDKGSTDKKKAGNLRGAAARGRGAAKPAAAGRGKATAAPGATGGVAKPSPAPTSRSVGLGRGLMGRKARTEAADAAAKSAAQLQEVAAAAGGNKKDKDEDVADVEQDAEDGFTGTFIKEVPLIMYGHGDDEQPLQETVEVVEAAMLQYIASVATKAAAVAASSLKPKFDERDVLFVVRKDPIKFARIKELLTMQQVIKEVRAIDKVDAKEGE